MASSATNWKPVPIAFSGARRMAQMASKWMSQGGLAGAGKFARKLPNAVKWGVRSASLDLGPKVAWAAFHRPYATAAAAASPVLLAGAGLGAAAGYGVHKWKKRGKREVLFPAS